MKIAIASETNNGLESPVSHHFGRCPFFTVVDVNDGQVKQVQSVDNPFVAQHQPGQVPGFISSQGVDVMISGGMGGRAIEFFRSYQIGVSTGASGTVMETLQRYLAGELNEAAPCAESIAHGHG
jgi:predicted Fe-Mo cluster-binding NifX family protein